MFVDNGGRLTLVEIEGGGAVNNYRGMKDIVETGRNGHDAEEVLGQTFEARARSSGKGA